MSQFLFLLEYILVIRSIIVYYQYDVVVLNTQLIAAFIGAVIFTMVIIFTGTLPDFIESEKMPSESCSFHQVVVHGR